MWSSPVKLNPWLDRESACWLSRTLLFVKSSKWSSVIPSHEFQFKDDEEPEVFRERSCVNNGSVDGPDTCFGLSPLDVP